MKTGCSAAEVSPRGRHKESAAVDGDVVGWEDENSVEMRCLCVVEGGIFAVCGEKLTVGA